MPSPEQGHPRVVLRFTAWLLLANAILIAVSLVALLVSDRSSYGGPLVVIPLGFLLPALAIALPYAIFLAGWGALAQIARAALAVIGWAVGKVRRWRRSPDRDPFGF